MHDPMPPGVQTDKKPRLLCVDDNVRFLEPFASLLQLCGYAVVTSDDPCAALPLALATDLDLAIVDYDMPHMNGIELAAELRRIKPGLPIVLFSGNPDLPQQDLDTVDEYILKGGSVQMLLGRLEALITKHRHGSRSAHSGSVASEAGISTEADGGYTGALPAPLPGRQMFSAAAAQSGD